MPTARKSGEDRDKFIQRCMREIYDEFPDNAQRYAVCNSYADKTTQSMKKEDLFILVPRKSENRGQFLIRCSRNSKIKSQLGDLKERMVFCLTSFNEYYKYWNKIKEDFAQVPSDTALGDCIAKKKSQGLDYKEAYARCASKVVVPNAPVVMKDNLLVEPVGFEEGTMDIFGYKTKYFYLCPGAMELFGHLTEMVIDDETKGMVRSAAQVADNIFQIEDEVMKEGYATEDDLSQAVILLEDFKDIIHEIDEETGMIHDVSFMDRHIDLIRSGMEYEMGLEDACWEGYEPYGLKPGPDGKLVPNCVPIKD